MSAALDPQTLAALHSNYLAYQQSLPKPQAKAQPQKKKQQGKGGTATSLISEVGGTGGAIGGAALGATIGSAVPILGTAVGGLLGAGIGGFLGGTSGRLAENKIRDNKYNVGSALKEGGIDAVLGAGPGKLLKGGQVAVHGLAGATPSLESALVKASEGAAEAPLKNSVRGKLTALGNNSLASQYGTISKPVARANKPLDTISKLANLGITKPIDAERIAGKFTGSNGLVNRAVVSATQGAAQVPIHTIPDIATESAVKNGLVDSDAKSIGNIVKAQVGRLGGEGSTHADPSKVLTVMKTLESQSADLLGKGGTYHLPTTTDKAKAAVLGDVKDELEKSLFKTADANGNVSKVLTPDFQKKLNALHPNNPQWKNFVDNTVMKSKTVDQLRSLQEPFVKISKIINEGSDNAITYGGRLGNNFRDSNTIKGGIANLATNAVKDPAARVAGKALRAAGGAAPSIGAGSIGAPQSAKKIASLIGLESGGEAAGNAYKGLKTGGLAFNNAAEGASPQPPDTSLEGALLSSSNQSDTSGQALDQGQTQDQSPYPRENLIADIQRDPQNASKYIDYYNSLTDVYNPKQDTPDTGYGKPTAAQYSQASTALQSVDQLEQLLGQDPSVTSRNAAPGQGLPGVGGLESRALGTGDYRAISSNILNAIARINTGANMPESEARFYQQTYLPQPGDNNQTINTKLQQLRGFFEPIANYQGNSSNSTDLTSALMQAGYGQ